MDSDRVEALLLDIVNGTALVSPATPEEVEVRAAMELEVVEIIASGKVVDIPSELAGENQQDLVRERAQRDVMRKARDLA
jgi:hypothetical protein